MLTPERKAEIINRNFDYVRPYVKRVIEELPDLENSVHIEGIAECWYDLEMKYGKKASVDSAIRAYEKEYARDAKEIEMMTGDKLPPLDIEKFKPKYVINEDLTHAVLENVKGKIDLAKKVEEHDGSILSTLLDDVDNDRFYGTIVNEETVKKLEKANSLLDIIKTCDGVTVQKFKEPRPRSDEGVVAINVVGGLSCFSGSVYKAFRELVGIADEFIVIPKSETVTRIALPFYNLWKESREMTDEEMEEENTISDADLEEAEKEIERFNKGEFSHD